MAKEERTIEAIESFYQITQNLSKDNQGKNFRCPCCDTRRIAKAGRTKEDDWYHTGCRCTYEYLSAHGLLIK